MENITKNYLKVFEEQQKKHPGPIDYSVSFDFKKHDRSLFFCAATHGDEVGGIPALLRMIDDLQHQKIQFGGKITFALGNIEAIKINKRFVVEDMNRIFGKADLSSPDAKRAAAIAGLISSHDVFVDLHQTIGPTKSAFYVVRTFPPNLDLCRMVGASSLAMIVDDEKLQNEKHGRVTGTTYANRYGVRAFTLELSQKGYSTEAEELAYKTIRNVMQIVEETDYSDWTSKANDYPAIEMVDIEYSHVFSERNMQLDPGHVNGAFYKKGDVLGKHGDKKIISPFDGYLFFPKYPERDQNGDVVGPVPSHLFELGRVVNK